MTNEPRDEINPQFIRDAAMFEDMVKHPGWQRFVEMVKDNSESWLASSGVPNSTVRHHPEYILGYMFGIKAALEKPKMEIDRKNKWLTEEARRKQEEVERAGADFDQREVRPRPQPV